LSVETLQRLRAARQRLWSVIENTRELRASELCSWRYVDGRYQAAPFGQNNGDADESNAAQLWSTVYLAIPPPAADSAPVSPLIGLFGFSLQRPLSPNSDSWPATYVRRKAFPSPGP
jgi:hypothetical protein